MITFKIKNGKRFLLLLSISIAIFTSLLFITPTLVQACSGSCPTGCYTSGSCNCTGPGGCRNKGTGCVSGEFECQGYLCCDNCDGSCGSCQSCSLPGCPTNYSTTNNGCSYTETSCTRYYADSCCGSCGESTRGCWLVSFTLTYTANSNGSISGTTPQTICRGSSGSAVTANPNSGYYFVSWSDSSTSNPRTDSNVTANISVSATFALTNSAPTAPTSLQTESLTNPTMVSDLTPEFSAIFNDPDTSDTGAYYQIQVNTASDFTGTSMWDSTLLSMTSTANGSRSPQISYAGTTLSFNGTTYYWRVRFADNSGATSPWSSVANFAMDTAPTAPTSLQTESLTNPTMVTDLTPEFSAVFNDPDTSDTGNYYQIQVNTASDFTGTSMWDSTLLSMTSTANGSRSSEISYAGTALSFNGTTYSWRVRFADNSGATSPWSSVANFTMNTAPAAPISLQTEALTNPLKVIDITPEFSAIFSDPNSTDTGNFYQIQVNTNDTFTGTTMWDSTKTELSPIIVNGTRSSEISYAGTTLSSNSQKYYWHIKFWDNHSGESEWSSTANFTMDGGPTSPTSLLTNDSTNPTKISSLIPYFSAIYSDPNGDNGNAYEIEINTNDSFTGTVMWDTGKISSSLTNNTRSSNYTYAGTPLTNTDITYYWRIRFWDSDDNASEWSSTAQFSSLQTSFLFEGLNIGGIKLD